MRGYMVLEGELYVMMKYLLLPSAGRRKGEGEVRGKTGVQPRVSVLCWCWFVRDCAGLCGLFCWFGGLVVYWFAGWFRVMGIVTPSYLLASWFEVMTVALSIYLHSTCLLLAV